MSKELKVRSTDYHKCMSDVYFTRAMVWLLSIGWTLDLEPLSLRGFMACVTAVLAFNCFRISYREYEESL